MLYLGKNSIEFNFFSSINTLFSSFLFNIISSEEDSADLAKELTTRESNLYFAGLEAQVEIEHWKRQGAALLKKSSLLGRRSRGSDVYLSSSSSSSNKRPALGK
jgi:hypothetical protein